MSTALTAISRNGIFCSIISTVPKTQCFLCPVLEHVTGINIQLLLAGLLKISLRHDNVLWG